MQSSMLKITTRPHSPSLFTLAPTFVFFSMIGYAHKFIYFQLWKRDIIVFHCKPLSLHRDYSHNEIPCHFWRQRGTDGHCSFLLICLSTKTSSCWLAPTRTFQRLVSWTCNRQNSQLSFAGRDMLSQSADELCLWQGNQLCIRGHEFAL